MVNKMLSKNYILYKMIHKMYRRGFVCNQTKDFDICIRNKTLFS